MGTIFDREHEPPEPEALDAVHAIASGIASHLLGAADLPGVAEFLAHVIGPPLAKRQHEWMHEVASAIRQLESKAQLTAEQLRENPAFVDAVLSASHAAIRSSQDGKRRALRNAILNSALPTAPQPVEQQVFISLVDRFTEAHLCILKLFQDPSAWRGAEDRRIRSASNLQGIIAQAYPELGEELPGIIWSDLEAAALHRSGSLRTTMSPHGTIAKRTTDFGDAFLRFIEDPFDKGADGV